MSNHTDLLTRIEQLAGPARAKTFCAAAEFVLHQDNNRILIETGCYRGIPQDGQSTLLLGLLAQHMNTWLVSIDIEANHLAKAQALVKDMPAQCFEFKHGDSVVELSALQRNPVLVYLDSFDHDPNNPGPCQRHQLAEVGAIYGKLLRPCAVLLDDNEFKSGGKTLLAKTFLQERGWKTAMEGYQILLIKE